MMIPYGLASIIVIFIASMELVGDGMDKWNLALYFGILGCVATWWLPLAASLWILYSIPGRSARELLLVLFLRLIVAVAAVLLALGICFELVSYSFSIEEFLGHSVYWPPQITHPATHDFVTDFGQGIADAFANVIVGIFPIFLVLTVILGTTLLPVGLVLLILSVFSAVALLLRVMKKPLELILERIFESPQGVVTQVGIGIAAIGKAGQLFLKYHGYA